MTIPIPNPFGGFAPFPNSIMIPVMGAQSAVLGFAFGMHYEAGKRTIRAMDNADFNDFVRDGKLVNDGVGENMPFMNLKMEQHFKQQIDFLKNSWDVAFHIQEEIIEQSVRIEIAKANRTPSAMAEIIQTFNTATSKLAGKITWGNLAQKWNDFFGGGQIGESPTIPDQIVEPPPKRRTKDKGTPQEPDKGQPAPPPPPEPTFIWNIKYSWTNTGQTKVRTRTMTVVRSRSQHKFWIKKLESQLQEKARTGSTSNVAEDVAKLYQYRKKYHEVFGEWV